jgi:hypothetical protein
MFEFGLGFGLWLWTLTTVGRQKSPQLPPAITSNFIAMVATYEFVPAIIILSISRS